MQHYMDAASWVGDRYGKSIGSFRKIVVKKLTVKKVSLESTTSLVPHLTQGVRIEQRG